MKRRENIWRSLKNLKLLFWKSKSKCSRTITLTSLFNVFIKPPKKSFALLSILSLIIAFIPKSLHAQCPSGYTTAGTDRVANGNFSSGNTNFTSDYIYVANGVGQTELVPEGYYSVYTNPNDLHASFAACTGHGGSGNFDIINGNTVNNRIIWHQDISVIVSTTYYFVTWVCSAHPTNPAQLQFSVNGSTIGSVFTASTTTCDWQEFYAIWNSGSNTSASISVVNKNTIAAGNDFALDDIAFVPCAPIVTPIELVTFKAVCNQNNTSIYWVTSSETNSSYFDVESSTDLNFWKIIKTLKAAENSNIMKYYSIEDNTIKYATTYYRLKQVDLDGQITYTEPTSIDCSSQVPFVSFISADNSDALQIIPHNFKSNSFTVAVYDALGKVMFSKTFSDIKNNSAMYIDLNAYPNGYYFMHFISDDYNKTSKILKFYDPSIN